MAKEARELERFLKIIEGAKGLADKAGVLASELEAAGILRITKGTPRVELPKGIRSENLTIGTTSKAAFREEFEQRGIRVGQHAQDLLDRIDFTDKPQDIELAWLSGRDLDLIGPPTYRQICEYAQTKGFALCPAEIGPHLRLKDTDQPLGSEYWIAMEPITDRYGCPRVFGLAHHEGDLWLDGYRMESLDVVWDSGSKLVFSLHK